MSQSRLEVASLGECVNSAAGRREGSGPAVKVRELSRALGCEAEPWGRGWLALWA